jgi:hypothetical protein
LSNSGQGLIDVFFNQNIWIHTMNPPFQNDLYESIRCFNFSWKERITTCCIDVDTCHTIPNLTFVVMGASEATQPQKLSPSSRWYFLYHDVYMWHSFSMIVSISYECIRIMQARIYAANASTWIRVEVTPAKSFELLWSWSLDMRCVSVRTFYWEENYLS